MSLDSTMQRIAALDAALANPALLVASARSTAMLTAETGGAQAPGSAGSFAEALAQASAYPEGIPPPAMAASGSSTPGMPAPGMATPGMPAIGASLGGATSTAATGASPLAPAGGSYASASPGQRIVSIAEAQVGQSEQPPGSNESPAIAEYRTATAGAIPGAPWCAYFASWVARQAGTPLGSEGQGLGAVSEIWSWAQSAGRALPNGPGVVPKPGDLIVFGGEHIGIVRRVLANGDLETIEGNYENKVALNVRKPSEPTGYVSMS